MLKWINLDIAPEEVCGEDVTNREKIMKIAKMVCYGLTKDVDTLLPQYDDTEKIHLEIDIRLPKSNGGNKAHVGKMMVSTFSRTEWEEREKRWEQKGSDSNEDS